MTPESFIVTLRTPSGGFEGDYELPANLPAERLSQLLLELFREEGTAAPSVRQRIGKALDYIHAHPDQAGRRKQIVTDVDVLRTAGPYALCRIGLITGRTHQIRAHLAYLGRPVLGDIKYGNRKANERAGAKTQALCAVRVSFLDIPEENTLRYLTGKVIKLKDPQILRQFDALDKSKQAD